MVEAAARSSQLAAEMFLQTNQGDPFSPAVLRCVGFLEFMKGEWAEGAAARAEVSSVEDALEQQVRLVGSRAIYDKINTGLSMAIINGKDLFFAKERLLLYSWRKEFVSKFFPKDMDEEGPLNWNQGGWWTGGVIEVQPDGMYDVDLVLVIAFDWTVQKAFHMAEDEVANVDEVWEILASETRSIFDITKQTSEASLLSTAASINYNLSLDISEDQSLEAEQRKFVMTYGHLFENLDFEEQQDEKLNKGYLKYFEKVVRALHSLGPPSLRDLASRRVLELDLPLWQPGELPKEVVEGLEAGPQERRLTVRGDHLIQALRAGAEEAEAEEDTEEEDEEGE
jgi:hypothetical protein